MYFVYILQCSDESYYVGSAKDVAERLAIHNAGQGPDFTAKRLPVKLVHQESFETLEAAVKREKQLKGWTRAKKAALINGDWKRLRALATCHQSLIE
jgi:putative endonuclease